MKKIIFYLFLTLLSKYSYCQNFSRQIIDTKCNFYNLGATWGDYDQDGDFDLMTTGMKMTTNIYSTALFENTNGVLTTSQSFTPSLANGDIKWCDFNNDNILDYVIYGTTATALPVVEFYIGTGSGFQLANMNQVSISNGYPCLNLVDYNNDGFQDLSITDFNSTIIYQNTLNFNTGVRDFIPFMNIPKKGFSTWKDIDLDGYQELFIYNTLDFQYYKYDEINNIFIGNTCYVRDNGQYYTFPQIGAHISFCDYNNDNFPDLLVTASSLFYPPTGFFTRLYTMVYHDLYHPFVFVENTNIIESNLNNTTGQFLQLNYSWASWGDVNNDGNFDIFITGAWDHGKDWNHALLYTFNTSSDKFIEHMFDNDSPNGAQMDHGSSQFGDYDDDGDLDIIYEGFDCYLNCGRKTILLKNELNTNPSIQNVTGCSSTTQPITGDPNVAKVTLSWNSVSGAKSYNVKLINTTTGQIYGAPMALSNGYRLVAEPGNATASAQPSKIFILPTGNYHWGVQVIDARYKGSSFTNGGTINICVDGSDLYMQDTPLDNGVEPNPDLGPMWVSDDIWNRTTCDNGTIHQNPEYGQQNCLYVRVRNRGCDAASGELMLYWSKASTGLSWPDTWVNYTTTIPGCTAAIYGNVINGVSIPLIASGSSSIIAIPWYPPNPEDFSCLGTEQQHFCLLARIITSSISPFGMTYTEGSDINLNTLQNNNIIWKNVSIVNDILPLPDPVPIITKTIIHNVQNISTFTKLKFDIPTEEEDNSFLKYGDIKIKLSSVLYQKWIAGGRMSDGIEDCNDSIIQIIDPHSWIDNILLDSQEICLISPIFDLIIQPSKCQFNYDISQYKTIVGKDILIGGVRYLLKTCASNNNAKIIFNDVADSTNSIEDKLCRIYPNPCDDNFYIDYEILESEIGILKIFDITGRDVFSEPLKGGKNTLLINASELEAGVYFYQALVGNKKIAADKIVVIK
jgi:hypothetical protein